MNDVLLHSRQMQLSAWLLLAVYTALALLVLPSELRFLREAEPRARWRFVALDVILQLCVLLVLLPCALAARLTQPLFIVIFAGFTGLWIVVLVMRYLRYIYTVRMLAAASAQQSLLTAELIKRGLVAAASLPPDSSAPGTAPLPGASQAPPGAGEDDAH